MKFEDILPGNKQHLLVESDMTTVECSASQLDSEYRVAPFASGFFFLANLAHSCSELELPTRVVPKLESAI